MGQNGGKPSRSLAREPGGWNNASQNVAPATASAEQLLGGGSWAFAIPNCCDGLRADLK